MKALATTVLWIAIAAFSVIGLSGIVFGPWEFTSSFPLDFSALSAADRATLFNQQRFFKALELSVGVGLFLARRRVHVDPGIRAVVAFVLWVTPLARVVSMVADGLPIVPFRALAGFELLGAALFTAYAVSLRIAPAQAAQAAGSTTA